MRLVVGLEIPFGRPNDQHFQLQLDLQHSPDLRRFYGELLLRIVQDFPDEYSLVPFRKPTFLA